MSYDEPLSPAGWRVVDWAEETTLSPSYVRLLVKQGAIRSVKAGKVRIILTPPLAYLEGLEAAQ